MRTPTIDQRREAVAEASRFCEFFHERIQDLLPDHPQLALRVLNASFALRQRLEQELSIAEDRLEPKFRKRGCRRGPR